MLLARGEFRTAEPVKCISVIVNIGTRVARRHWELVQFVNGERHWMGYGAGARLSAKRTGLTSLSHSRHTTREQTWRRDDV